MELPNQDKFRTLAENEIYKYLGILEADTIKQVEMKNKIQKEYLRRTRKLLETKLSSQNLIKGINTWSVPLVRYSGPIFKWTRGELFITSMAHFSMPNSIPMSWLYILTACIRVSSSFSFFANSLMSSMYIKWLIFSCDLPSFIRLCIFWVWV